MNRKKKKDEEKEQEEIKRRRRGRSKYSTRGERRGDLGGQEERKKRWKK